MGRSDLYYLQQLRVSETATDAGFYSLPSGRALSLRAQQPSVLRAGMGGLWLTSSRCQGDHFLQPGQRWLAHTGEQVVIEPWRVPAGSAARFSWDSVEPLLGQSQPTKPAPCSAVGLAYAP